MERLARTTLLALMLVSLSATAAFAHPGHSHDDDDKDYADPVLFDGEIVTDCALTVPGIIRWELTGSDNVTYAELHIDEPEASVTSRNTPPYIFFTPRYDLDLVEADADRIVGEIDADARLIATVCDANDAQDESATPWLPAATGIAGLAVGVLLGRKRGTTATGA